MKNMNFGTTSKQFRLILFEKNNNVLLCYKSFVSNSPNHAQQCKTIKTNLDENDKPKRLVDKVSAIPHPVSKLRLFNYAIPDDETVYEKRLRERRISIQNRNHEYWSEINTAFNQRKKNFIESELKDKNKADFTSQQTHEELAQFYKRFLDDNHKRYIDYNFEWYRNNLSLLWPSFVVWLIRLKIRFKKNLQTKS